MFIVIRILLFYLQFRKKKISAFPCFVNLSPTFLQIVLLSVVLSLISAYCGKLNPTIKSEDLQLDDIEDHIGYKSGKI